MFAGLSIKNFRCFRDFSIQGLTRVNLISGANDAGKTALLEAVFLLLGEGNPELALRAGALRGLNKAVGVAEDIARWMWVPLFNGLNTDVAIDIQGVCLDGSHRHLQLMPVQRSSVAVSMNGESVTEAAAEGAGLSATDLEVRFSGNGGAGRAHRLTFGEKGTEVRPAAGTPSVPGYFLAVRGPNFDEDANLLGRLDRAKESYDLLAVLHILEPRLTRIRNIPSPGGTIIHGDIGLPEMLALGLLGNGLNRLTEIMLRVATARNGVVLIDEIENGFHHSVISKVWMAIAEAAKSFNVQIFATTHSWECIRAAHDAFSQYLTYDMRLYRLDRVNGDVQAVAYDQEMIETALASGLETR